jgi:hypothetical protein
MRGDVLQKVKRLLSVVVVLNLAFGGFLGLILIVDDNVVEGPLQIPDPIGDTIYVDTGDNFIWDGSDIPNRTLDIDNNLVIRNGGILRIINATIIFQSDIDHRYSLLIDNGGELYLVNSTITVQTTDLFDNYENKLWFNYSRGVAEPAPTQETSFRRLIPFNLTVRGATSRLDMKDGSSLRFHGDLYIDNTNIDIADSIISSPEFHHMTHDWGIVVQIVDCASPVVFADTRIEKSPWYQGIQWHDPDSGDVNTDPIQMFANHTVKNSDNVVFINTYFDLDYLNKSQGSLYEVTKDDHHPPGVNPRHNALNIYDNSDVRFFGLTIDMSETVDQIPLDGSTAIEVKDVLSSVALYRWLWVYPVDNQNVPLDGATVDITSWYTGNSDIDVKNDISDPLNLPVKDYIESLRGGTYSQPNAQTVRCVTGGSGIAVFGLLSDLLTDTGWPNSDQKDGYNILATYPPTFSSSGTVEFENFPRVFDGDNTVNYRMDPFDFASPAPELWPEFVTPPPTSALENVAVDIDVRVWNEIINVGEDVTSVRVQFWEHPLELTRYILVWIEIGK